MSSKASRRHTALRNVKLNHYLISSYAFTIRKFSKNSLPAPAFSLALRQPIFANQEPVKHLEYHSLPGRVGPLERLLDAHVGPPLPKAVLDGACVCLALRVGQYPPGAHRRHVGREVEVTVVVLHEPGKQLPEGPGILALEPLVVEILLLKRSVGKVRGKWQHCTWVTA